MPTSILKRRTKLVSFRVSDEEYEKLQGACLAEGARSLSEFARAALQRSVREHVRSSDLPVVDGAGSATRELIETIRDLNRKLGHLVSLAQSGADESN